MNINKNDYVFNCCTLLLINDNVEIFINGWFPNTEMDTFSFRRFFKNTGHAQLNEDFNYIISKETENKKIRIYYNSKSSCSNNDTFQIYKYKFENFSYFDNLDENNKLIIQPYINKFLLNMKVRL